MADHIKRLIILSLIDTIFKALEKTFISDSIFYNFATHLVQHLHLDMIVFVLSLLIFGYNLFNYPLFILCTCQTSEIQNNISLTYG